MEISPYFNSCQLSGINLATEKESKQGCWFMAKKPRDLALDTAGFTVSVTS